MQWNASQADREELTSLANNIISNSYVISKLLNAYIKSVKGVTHIILEYEKTAANRTPVFNTEQILKHQQHLRAFISAEDSMKACEKIPIK